MSEREGLTLSLLENSHAFLSEAVEKAVAAKTDARHWQFAIVNLVQSLELSLKAALKDIHPVLIFENVDNPRNTVGPLLALERLLNPKIGRMTFSENDVRKIRRAVEVRNQITHSDFELTVEYAAAKFVEIFAFVSEFQRQRLKTKVSDVIAPSAFERLLQIRKLVEELEQRAEMRIAEENISRGAIWECPNCGALTFVTEDGIDTCYACTHAETVVQCPHCSRFVFEAELQSFFGELDSDYEEGRTVVHNWYGYRDHRACEDCLPRIKQDIHDQRTTEEFHRLEDEYLRR